MDPLELKKKHLIFDDPVIRIERKEQPIFKLE